MSHSDRPDPESILLHDGQPAATPEDVFAVFDSLGIEQKPQVPDPLYTVEQAKTVVYSEPGAHTKNLFLRNKKGLYLGVVPGSVSPLALINDHGNAVQLLIQESILQNDWIYMHPCRNTHSTRIKVTDLIKVVEHWEHTATSVSFDS